jgi:hypothetical protein
MKFDVLINESEPKPSAFGTAASSGDRPTSEPFKNEISLIRRNTGAMIFDSDPNL